MVFDSKQVDALFEHIQDYRAKCVAFSEADKRKQETTKLRTEGVLSYRRMLMQLEVIDAMVCAHEPRLIGEVVTALNEKGGAL